MNTSVCLREIWKTIFPDSWHSAVIKVFNIFEITDYRLDLLESCTLFHKIEVEKRIAYGLQIRYKQTKNYKMRPVSNTQRHGVEQRIQWFFKFLKGKIEIIYCINYIYYTVMGCYKNFIQKPPESFGFPEQSKSFIMNKLAKYFFLYFFIARF